MLAYMLGYGQANMLGYIAKDMAPYLASQMYNTWNHLCGDGNVIHLTRFAKYVRARGVHGSSLGHLCGYAVPEGHALGHPAHHVKSGFPLGGVDFGELAR